LDYKLRVTAGLPVYNAESTIEDCILSLLKQTYPVEIIIVDNNSSDMTHSIAQRYAAQYPNIRVFKQELNIGAPENFKAAVRNASTELFFWAAADDLWSENWLEEQVKNIVQTNAPLSFGCLRTITIDGDMFRSLAPLVDLGWFYSLPARLRSIAFFLAPEVCGLNAPIYGVFRTKELKDFLQLFSFDDRPYIDYLFMMDFCSFNEVAFSGGVHYKRIHSASWTSAQKSDRALNGIRNYFRYFKAMIIREPLLTRVLFLTIAPLKLILFILFKCLDVVMRRV
jgi:glycosyltransferase involved in cell wall biosynthesis